jgi:hypothetical protein
LNEGNKIDNHTRLSKKKAKEKQEEKFKVVVTTKGKKFAQENKFKKYQSGAMTSKVSRCIPNRACTQLIEGMRVCV